MLKGSAISFETDRAFFETTWDLLRDHLELESREGMAHYRSADDLLSEIDLSIRKEGVDDAALFESLRDVSRRSPRTGSNRFFNQLFGGRDAPAIAGDLLATVLNNSMYTYKAAGVNALIERELIDRMCGFVGFDNGEGVFAPGGSMSNLQAMIVARNEVLRGSIDDGFDGTRVRVYVSEEGHYSINKMAQVVGIGHNNVRAVPADERGRMRTDSLREMMDEDAKAGIVPLMVVITAGTTVLGAFDPIIETVEIAKAHGAWVHIDGAFGGSIILSKRHRHLMDGCELADSITWDAHKMMGVPLVSSVILVRKKGVLCRNFNENASYLFQEDSDDLNFGTRSLQCGRRNDCLKLWAAWKHHGDAGYERRMDTLVGLARFFAELVESDPELTLSKNPESVNVCFEVTGKGSAAICETLRTQDRLMMGWGIVDERRVIRVPFVNADITKDDARAMLGEIKLVASALEPQDNAVDAPSPYVCC